MSKKLFVGRLPYDFTDEKLRELFTGVGTVLSAVMVQDPKQGRSRGFGFVAMSTEEASLAAIAKLNGTHLGEKDIWVTEAREKPRQPQAAAPRHPPREDRRPFSSTDRRPFSAGREGHFMGPRSRGPGADRPPRRFGGGGPPSRPGGSSDRRPAFGKFGARPAGSSDRRPAFGKFGARSAGSSDRRPGFGKFGTRPAGSSDRRPGFGKFGGRSGNRRPSSPKFSQK
ncbi:MAG: RNA-binding protein [Elusimicrobiota bacterium]